MRKSSWTVGLVVITAFSSLPLLAEEKPASVKPSGTWARSAGDADLKIDFKSGSTMVFTLTRGEGGLQLTADYGMSKDGVLFGRVASVEKKNTDDGPAEGDLFSFRVKIDGKVMTLSELRDRTGDSGARELVEGEYRSVKQAN